MGYILSTWIFLPAERRDYGSVLYRIDHAFHDAPKNLRLAGGHARTALYPADDHPQHTDLSAAHEPVCLHHDVRHDFDRRCDRRKNLADRSGLNTHMRGFATYKSEQFWR